MESTHLPFRGTAKWWPNGEWVAEIYLSGVGYPPPLDNDGASLDLLGSPHTSTRVLAL
jgi:hypothetical protein